MNMNAVMLGTVTRPPTQQQRSPSAMGGYDPSLGPAIGPTAATKSEPKPPRASGPHACLDYQAQVMLLEQQTKKRLMMARQEQEFSQPLPPPQQQPSTSEEPLSDFDFDSFLHDDGPNTFGSALNLQPEIPAREFVPQPHYTISEDEVGRGQANNLAAIQSKPDLKSPSPGRHVQNEGYSSAQKQAALQALQQQASQQRAAQQQASQLRAAQQRALQQQAKLAQQQRILAQQWQQQARQDALIQGPPQGFQQGTIQTPNSLPRIQSQLQTPSTQQAQRSILGGTSGAPYPALDITTPPGPDHLHNMLEYIRTLENQLGIEPAVLTLNHRSAINIQEFHCLESPGSLGTSFYLAEPEWVVRDEDVMLRGRFPVHDPESYLQKRGNITFAVYKDYNTRHQQEKISEAMKANECLPVPEPASMSCSLISAEMTEAAKAFISLHPSFSTEFPEQASAVKNGGKISAPFIWWYHYRKSHGIRNLPPRQAELMTALTEWIERNYGHLYDKFDAQFRSGRVSAESLEYLIRPGHVLVKKEGKTLPLGFVATSRPELMETRVREPQEHDKKKYNWSFAVRVRSYQYNGGFFRSNDTVDLNFGADVKDGEVDIRSIDVVPLQYADLEVKELLARRGKTFWKCRNKRLVSYEGSPNSTDQKHAGQRFMTDFSTYKELHPNNKYVLRSTIADGGNIYASAFGNAGRSNVSAETDSSLPTDDSEPEAPEVYLFPTSLPGFDLRRKKWVDLEVDRIRDVTWNDQAFQSLVADKEMKQLVLALVTNQLATESATDLIDNKGNGLIMLLHGSPGTGKTFTAESVAEIAKKPLYSVTCGDIGTEPEHVEKYLASVFHLGKIWDCVVLLDEAEVFLEQRTLQDLKRNALVSVFLRALEYYEGILILTTNRVGTFDEAFKSRIQLALRYEKLRDGQRKQIWRNFLDRLRSLGEAENIDFNDVELHLDELAAHPMNGREIRNSITTGRQLAKFLKEKMTYSHLKKAIGVAEKFDQYLAEVREADVDESGVMGVNGRYTDDFFARQEQLR